MLINAVDRTWVNATGLIVPTNEALSSYLKGNSILGEYYNSYNEMPLDVLGIFLGTNFFTHYWSICPSHFGKSYNIGFDLVDLQEKDVVDKKLCSNGLFVGVNTVFSNSSFSTVMGPLLLDTTYLIMLKTVKDLGIASALQSKGSRFSILGVRNDQFIQVADPNSATRKVTVVGYEPDLSQIYLEVTGDPDSDNNRIYPDPEAATPSSEDVAYVSTTLKDIILNQIIEEDIDPDDNNYYQTKSVEFV